MKYHEVILRTSPKDLFTIPNGDGGKILNLYSITEESYKTPLLTHNIKRTLFAKNLIPSETIIDFLNLSVAVYTADQLISRSAFGYLGWNRYIKLNLPVLNIEAWTKIKEALKEMLSFLSGDKWEINLRERSPYNLPGIKPQIKADQVSLFSGGLDSYIGAIDLLSDHGYSVLVGHHKSGPNELAHQKRLVGFLGNRFSSDKVIPFYFHVQPQIDRNLELDGESSQRARSILFMSLGLAIANSIDPNLKVNVPENGLISLNIPLTESRIGSLSTRTTHPYFFHLLNSCLERLGVNNEIQNPYKFYTKGEMLLKCKDAELLHQTSEYTVSCSKPGHYKRWYKKDKVHCGHCTPCIIRRASMLRAGIDNGKEYVFDVKKKTPSITDSMGRDYYAFMAAIERNRNRKLSILDIAESGPLPGSPDELYGLKDVYIRGMDEVKTFLQK